MLKEPKRIIAEETCDEIALPEIWKSDVRKWKSSMRVYSRSVLSRPYTSRMDLSCSASILVMLI